MIKDEPMNRSDLIDRTISYGKEFIKHFDKIYNNQNSQTVKFWCKEMQGMYDKICSMSFKQSLRGLSRTEKTDWFFSAGDYPSKFFTNFDIEEEEVNYDQFVNDLEQNKDVIKSIETMLGIKL